MNKRVTGLLLAFLALTFMLAGCSPDSKKTSKPAKTPALTGPRQSKSVRGKPSNKIIADLLFALEAKDLKVEKHTLGDYQKKRLDRLESTIAQNKKLGRPDSKNPIEVAVRKVNGVEVNFLRYSDSYRPREIYEELQKKRNQAKKDDDRAAMAKYNTVEIVKGPFLLMIYRWEPVTNADGKLTGKKTSKNRRGNCQ